MAKQDKLIDYAYLKEEIDVPQNIPDSEFESKIYRAQDMLAMLIGGEFYVDLVTNYKANTLSVAYSALMPYLKKFLAWQTCEYWTVRTNFKPTRSGFRIHTEENSSIPSDTQMAVLIKDAKQEAQKYKTFMLDYLNDNYSSYPLYSNRCENNNAGNSFHISAVKKKHHHKCKCNRCRC